MDLQRCTESSTTTKSLVVALYFTTVLFLLGPTQQQCFSWRALLLSPIATTHFIKQHYYQLRLVPPFHPSPSSPPLCPLSPSFSPLHSPPLLLFSSLPPTSLLSSLMAPSSINGLSHISLSFSYLSSLPLNAPSTITPSPLVTQLDSPLLPNNQIQIAIQPSTCSLDRSLISFN